jgi:hypothetical protein
MVFPLEERLHSCEKPIIFFMPVRLPACIIATTIGRISAKFDIAEF